MTSRDDLRRPRVMFGQAVITRTRVPVSVILDRLAADMTADEITAEYPAVTVADVHVPAHGTTLAREGVHISRRRAASSRLRTQREGPDQPRFRLTATLIQVKDILKKAPRMRCGREPRGMGSPADRWGRGLS